MSAISNLFSHQASFVEYEEVHSFEESCSKAICDLSRLVDNGSLDMYRKVFAHIQDIPQSEEVKIVLTRLIVAVANQGLVSDYEELVKEAADFSIRWGKASLVSFHKNINQSVLADVITAFALSNQTEHADYISTQLEKFIQKKIDFAGFLEELKKMRPSSKLVTEQKELKPLLERFTGKDSNVIFSLSKKKLAIIEKQYAIVEDYCKKWQYKRLGRLISEASNMRAKGEFQEEDILKLIAIGRLSLYDTYKLYLHHTQVLAVLGQLCHAKGCIAQVKTGEGKSMISTLLAFVLAMQNKSVHLISSARALSLRDQQKLFSFFQLFGIKTSHICIDHPKASCFKAQVLYGTASDFEFAIMREMLDLTPLFEQEIHLNGKKRFDCVIVDEVDNLTIDTARNHARSSHPAEISYAWVYQPVVSFVKERFTEDCNDQLFSKNTLQDLRKMLQGLQPGQLQDEQLIMWLQSAFAALFLMEEHKDYIVQKSSSQKKILVVDAKNTGRILHAVRWGSGLHACVEIKHGIEPKKETLNPLALAHAVLYPMYDAIFGLTGTLGSQVEREEIKEIYGIDSFDVPTYNPCIRKDHPTKVLFSNSEWLEAILQKVKDCIAQDRPILVLAETIGDSQIIENLLKKEKISLEMLNEIQSKSEETILNKAGFPKAVTIATNTAGRGTDIKLTQRSLQQGGLHVLLTFFPSSERVGDQARGRAGRQGEPGSSEIIVSIEKLALPIARGPHMQEKAMQWLEQKRLVQTRIDKHMHTCLADMERYCFSFAIAFFTKFTQFNQNFSEEGFMEKCKQALSHQIITVKEGLNRKDFYLAQRVIIELLKTNASKITWKILMKEMIERLKNKAINQWSIEFYRKVEKLLAQSNFESNAAMQEKIQQVFDLREGRNFFADMFISMIVDAQTHEMTELKQKIKALYEEHKPVWEKYLDPSGSGIIEYIQEITQPLETFA